MTQSSFSTETKSTFGSTLLLNSWNRRPLRAIQALDNSAHGSTQNGPITVPTEIAGRRRTGPMGQQLSGAELLRDILNEAMEILDDCDDDFMNLDSDNNPRQGLQ